MRTTIKELEKKTVRKDIFLTQVQMTAITRAAELQGLNASTFISHYAFLQAKKILEEAH
jgi:uncharacterized protein (DUF1778 family)